MDSWFKTSDFCSQNIINSNAIFYTINDVSVILFISIVINICPDILHMICCFMQIDITRESAYQTWIDFSLHLARQIFTVLMLIILLSSRSVSLTTVTEWHSIYTGGILQCRWLWLCHGEFAVCIKADVCLNTIYSVFAFITGGSQRRPRNLISGPPLLPL